MRRARIRSTSRSSNSPQHRLDDHEALGRDAALPAVDEPRGGAGLGRRVEVGVLEHDVGVAAAQLEDALLQARAGLRGDGAARGRAAGERHRGDVRRLDRGPPRATTGRAASGTPRAARRPRAGSPRSRARSRVTLEACFSRPTLPAISAGAAKRNTCQSGKFQGITASTGAERLERDVALRAPRSGRARARAGARRAPRSSRRRPAHLSASARPWATGLPISRAISRASASRRSRSRAAARRRMAARSSNDVRRQDSKASRRLGQGAGDLGVGGLGVLADQGAVGGVDRLEGHRRLSCEHLRHRRDRDGVRAAGRASARRSRLSSSSSACGFGRVVA